MPRIFLMIGTAVLAGCISVKLVPTVYVAAEQEYVSNHDVLKALKARASTLDKFAVSVEPSDPSAHVNRVSVRGGMVLTASSGSFAGYLQDAMTADLKEAGLFDPHSKNRIQIEIVKNEIEAPLFSDGTETLQVHLKVKKGSVTVLDKNYSAKIGFESYFSGSETGPSARDAYSRLVQDLFSGIYLDPAFVNAIKKI